MRTLIQSPLRPSTTNDSPGGDTPAMASFSLGPVRSTVRGRPVSRTMCTKVSGAFATARAGAAAVAGAGAEALSGAAVALTLSTGTPNAASPACARPGPSTPATSSARARYLRVDPFRCLSMVPSKAPSPAPGARQLEPRVPVTERLARVRHGGTTAVRRVEREHPSLRLQSEAPSAAQRRAQPQAGARHPLP